MSLETIYVIIFLGAGGGGGGVDSGLKGIGSCLKNLTVSPTQNIFKKITKY